MKPRRGFSLVEALVVILVLAVLASLIVPAFAGFQSKARDAQSLSTIRQLHFAVQNYGNDHQLRFPYFGLPGDPESPYQLRGHDISWTQGYFKQLSFLWVSLLRPDYFGAIPSLDPSFVSSEAADGELIWCRFNLTNTVFADPEYWREPILEEGEKLGFLMGTRWSQVRWPSRKGLIIDLALAGRHGEVEPIQGDVLVGSADGSAGFRPIHTRSLQVRRPYGSAPVAGMATQDGLEGIDW